MQLFKRLFLLVVLFALLSIVLPLSAHGYIVRAIPEDRAVLERQPTRVQYWFSEDLEPDFSSLILRDQTGAVLATGGVSDENQTLLSLRMPTGLPDGAYIVELRPAFASDGHVNAESRVFFVGAEVGGVSGSSGYTVIPLEVIWRTILLASCLLLFGTFVIYSAILVPAWGNSQYRAGFLPPRVMRRLNRMVIFALTAAFAANMVALIQQSMTFFNTGAAEVLTQGLWSVVRIGSRFGDVWNGRMLLLLLVALLHGLSIYLRERQPEMVRAFWAGNVWITALVMGTFSITSHGAGSLLWPWIAIIVDWLHGVAVGAWLGGLAALVLIMPVVLQPYSDAARRLALLAALRRFSRLATGALAVVIATGVYSSVNWLNTPAELTQTAWGGALLIKVLLVGGLLLLGLVNHILTHPERYERWSQRLGTAFKVASTLRLEVLLALMVLVTVGNLSAVPVPVPDFIEKSAPSLNAIQMIEDLTISMTLSPGGTGVNTYDTLVTSDDQEVEGADVRIRIVNPEMDWRGDWEKAESVDVGLYVTASADIDALGQWLTLVDVVQPDGEPVRAAFDWSIMEDANIAAASSPGLINIAALAGVIIAGLWAILPVLRRLYDWLDWSPASVSAALSAIIATVLVMVTGYDVVQRGQADYDAAINPPPQIINSVLPDAQSLLLGRDLYEQHCAWSGRSLTGLQEQLSGWRDEQIFAISRDGWQNLPPCSGDLSDEQRWNIVNYVRTLETR